MRNIWEKLFKVRHWRSGHYRSTEFLLLDKANSRYQHQAVPSDTVVMRHWWECVVVFRLVMISHNRPFGCGDILLARSIHEIQIINSLHLPMVPKDCRLSHRIAC